MSKTRPGGTVSDLCQHARQSREENSNSSLFCALVCCTSKASLTPSAVTLWEPSTSSIIHCAKGLCNLTYRLSCHNQSSLVSSSPRCSVGGNSLISPPVPVTPKPTTVCGSSIAPRSSLGQLLAVLHCGTTPPFRPSRRCDVVLGHSDDDHPANSCSRPFPIDMADMVSKLTINVVVKLQALIDSVLHPCPPRDVISRLYAMNATFALPFSSSTPCSVTAVTSARHSSYTHP